MIATMLAFALTLQPSPEVLAAGDAHLARWVERYGDTPPTGCVEAVRVAGFETPEEAVHGIGMWVAATDALFAAIDRLEAQEHAAEAAGRMEFVQLMVNDAERAGEKAGEAANLGWEVRNYRVCDVLIGLDASPTVIELREQEAAR